ncbi:hypothetical protein QH494_18895 [Sphingomonas sp. AR_OL41]|uniref:hypothetical protein n=1 Tax=Sphingomonas sp. AR_OL41 TaxID=3042729 RepID=UPI0024806E80|nr:hypothetical protein [Sphingomonas sp. AR_OL41]MDH7974260.1 hypothetical protein [Sphingomonas sp. AR_OL41]
MKFILFFFILSIGFGAAFAREPSGYKTIVKNVNCTFSVGKKTYISGPCKYTYYETPTIRGFQLEQKRPKNYFSYFVVVDLTYWDRGTGMLWNGPNIKAMHAEEDLGHVKKRGQCWFNSKARLCIIK